MIKFYNTMPKDAKDKWLAALRSGKYTDGVFVPKYKQGKGRLFTLADNSYCCLGVLQHCLTGDVERNSVGDSAALPSLEWLKSNNIQFSHYRDYKDHGDTPIFYIGNEQIALATCLNDKHEYTFQQIADLIEEQVEGI